LIGFLCNQANAFVKSIFFQIAGSLCWTFIAAAIADRIATAGALIFRVQFFLFLQLRDRHLLW
jgi:hypothetical protein